MGNTYQQGDVLITQTDRVKGKRLDHLILAEGEATGHCHEAIGDAVLYVDADGKLSLEVGEKGATIMHEEHKPITLPQGHYDVKTAREYDHLKEEAKRVVD